MAKISEVLAKAQKDPVLLMDLITDVEAALSQHNIDVDFGDLPDLKAAMKTIKADLSAQLTRLQVSYAEEGRWGGIVGTGLS